MSEPVYLFEEVVSNSGVTDVYYYENHQFHVDRRNAGFCGEVLKLNGTEITYDEFNDIYNEFKKEYCFDADVVNTCLREYKIKNLLD